MYTGLYTEWIQSVYRRSKPLFYAVLYLLQLDFCQHPELGYIHHLIVCCDKCYNKWCTNVQQMSHALKTNVLFCSFSPDNTLSSAATCPQSAVNWQQMSAVVFKSNKRAGGNYSPPCSCKNLFIKYCCPLPVTTVVLVTLVLPSGLLMARSFTSNSIISILRCVGIL